MLKYLQKVLGKTAVNKNKVNDIALPVYLRRYSYECFEIYGREYIFVAPKGELNLKSYNVQRINIETIFHMPSVLVANGATSRQKHNLVENGIMFVVEGGQLFMPTVGLILGKEKESVKKVIQHFTPQIQQCALFFLYMGNREYSTNEISAKLKMNLMAVSRGVVALAEFDVIQVTYKARQKLYSRNVGTRQYIDKINSFLINPVAEEVIIRKDNFSGNLKAGYTALSEYSDIADNDLQTFAVYKKHFTVDCEQCINEGDNLILNGEYIKVQLWKYDPIIFSVDEKVDRLSLALSFSKSDERTEAAIEKLREEIYADI